MGTFRFKQFSVTDDGATMKVGTDAVLLGSWCPVGQAKRILDIGTGSGLIALMLAQRSVDTARIDAVELNARDAEQALANVNSSPWPQKVNVIQGSVQSHQPDYRYELIVSNPPFFSRSLLPPDPRRSDARHTTRLTSPDLIAAVCRLLDSTGTFSLILPTAEAEGFRVETQAAGLSLARITRFQTRPTKPTERVLMSFTRRPTSVPLDDSLVLYEKGEEKSEGYQRLTADFYL